MLVSLDHLAPTPMRDRLVAHLEGRGLELGPGHQPFPVPAGVSVALVDQWRPDDSRALFYELDESISFAEPDIVANLDTDRLASVPDESQDFVIASHILEHLADPLGMLAEIHRVLRVDGLLLALLPDRRRTFDRTRFGTALQHVVDEHEAGTQAVDDAHIVEFILHADHLMRRAEGVEPEPLTGELIDAHRLRSVHAHCWTEDEFIDVLVYCARDLGVGYALLDGLSARAGQGGWEFGFALQKRVTAGTDSSDPSDPTDPTDPTGPTEQFLAAWAAVIARQDAVDRWPVGAVLARVVQEWRAATSEEMSPSEVGALSEVIDVVLHRADLRDAFALPVLNVDAALVWAARVASGSIVDSSGPRLARHGAALARWA